MFERFTTQARDAVISAQREARELGHRHIGTEHLLLALLDPRSGAAAAVLRETGVNHDGVRADIERLLSGPRDGLDEKDAAALEAIGIDLDAVRAKIEEVFGPGALDALDRERGERSRRRGLFRRKGAQGGQNSGHIRAGSLPGSRLPFTPRAKKVLELALREALHLRHGYITAEHILLGLLREGRGLAAKVLADAGVDVEDLRRRTLAALGDQAA
jgi:ATP-dependent Clp protease ATP-binding subunit ClpA